MLPGPARQIEDGQNTTITEKLVLKLEQMEFELEEDETPQSEAEAMAGWVGAASGFIGCMLSKAWRFGDVGANGWCVSK